MFTKREILHKACLYQEIAAMNYKIAQRWREIGGVYEWRVNMQEMARDHEMSVFLRELADVAK